MALHRTAERAVTCVELRPMLIDDAEMVLAWRNDPYIVARSSSQRIVSRDEHLDWMRHAVDDENRLCHIILVDGTPAGQLRFDRTDGRAVVTIYLLEHYTDRGVGVRALGEGMQVAFARWSDVDAIDALVRLDNDAGREAFRRAGFASAGATQDGHEKFVLMRSPDDTRAGWETDTAQNRAFYAERDVQFGVDVRAVNWGSRTSQVRRFEILAQIGQLGTDTVLDVGCGQGDFYAWLRNAGYGGKYTGIDITPRMIDTASRRFPQTTFRQADLMDGRDHSDLRRDWVFASGIFYLRRHEPLRYLMSAVDRMFSLANKGLAFNSLSSWSSKKDEGEFFADPFDVLKVCRGLTSRVALRHDYHPGDFTIYMLKEAADR